MDRGEIEARIGRRIGRWQIDHLLGVGGMAAVYACHDQQTRSLGAIKVLHSQFIDHTIIRRRFAREREVLAMVEHPCAVAVLDPGQDNSALYYVMEFLEGQTVDDLWREHKGRVPLDIALRLTDQLLDVLGAYHQRGVIHRDLKPANLFVTREGVLKLLDFGVARYREEGDNPALFTRSGTAVGTPSFMAPEQAMGRLEQIDERSDIFAVGAVLYTLLSGTLLHIGGDNDARLISAATTPAESLARVATDVPHDVVAIVDRALEWIPADRYASAADMRQAIRQVRARHASPDSSAIHAAAAFVQEETQVESAKNVATIREFFRQVQRTLEGTRLYHWGHREVERRLTETFDAARNAMRGELDGITFRIRPNLLENRDESVWSPAPPFDRIPYNLFAAGFRHIRLLPGLSRDEIARFIHLLTLDPRIDLPPEDDLATAFWDVGLTSVEAQMATAFNVSDDEAEQARFEQQVQTFRREVDAMLQRASMERLRDLAALQQVGPDAVNEAQAKLDRALESRYAKSASNPEFRKQFRAALAENGADADQREAWILGHAINDASTEGDLERLEGALREIVPRRLLENDLDALVRLIDRIYRIVGEQGRPAFLAKVFAGSNVALIADAVTRPDAALERELAKRLRGYLKCAPADAFDETLDALLNRPRALRLFELYLAENLEGRGHALEKIVQTADERACQSLLTLAKTSPSRFDAGLVVGSVMTHCDGDLRAKAFDIFENDLPREFEPWLGAVLTYGETATRVRALRIAAEHRFRSAVETLTPFIDDTDFHTRPYTERRLFLESLFQLDHRWGEDACIRLTSKPNRRGIEPPEQTTMALAIELLGDHADTMEARHALESAMHKRAPDRVRDAAQRALNSYDTRMSSRG